MSLQWSCGDPVKLDETYYEHVEQCPVLAKWLVELRHLSGLCEGPARGCPHHG